MDLNASWAKAERQLSKNEKSIARPTRASPVGRGFREYIACRKCTRLNPALHNALSWCSHFEMEGLLAFGIPMRRLRRMERDYRRSIGRLAPNYVEDCQICCKPNVLTVTWDLSAGEYTVSAELE